MEARKAKTLVSFDCFFLLLVLTAVHSEYNCNWEFVRNSMYKKFFGTSERMYTFTSLKDASVDHGEKELRKVKHNRTNI